MPSINLRLTELKVRRDIRSILHLFIYSQDQYRDIYIRDAAFFQVPHALFKIRDSCGHFINKVLCGNNFNSCVDITQLMKDRHLCADVVNHKGVFAKLNLHAEVIFDEIHFTKCAFS